MNEILIKKTSFIHNLLELKKNFPRKKLCLVIKKNAYGHGIKEIVSIIKDENLVDFLAVYSLEEANKVLSVAKNFPILVFSFFENEDIPFYLNEGLHFTISTLEQVDKILIFSKKQNKIAFLQVMVDTGMNREGCREEDFISILKKIEENKNYLKLTGVFSHFIFAGSFAKEKIKTSLMQIAVLKKLINKIKDKKNLYLHIENSDGILQFNDDLFNMYRVGIASYGYSSLLGNFKKVMQVKSTVVLIKKVKANEGVSYNYKYIFKEDNRVAIIPIGYANGVFRSLSNKLKVKIKGKVFNQVGNICMDQMMIDLKNDSDIKLGDEVFLFHEAEDANSMAEKLNTLPYEILCSFKDIKRKII